MVASRAYAYADVDFLKQPLGIASIAHALRAWPTLLGYFPPHRWMSEKELMWRRDGKRLLLAEMGRDPLYEVATSCKKQSKEVREREREGGKRQICVVRL
jgi:hypothetical protein